MTREVDVLIVTALKLEFEQVLKVEDGAEDAAWTEERGPLGLDVAFRSFRGTSGTLRVAVTWATDMGMVAASTAAIPLMEKYQPQCIAMSGVCAGRPGKVELGDVIIADRLWTYDAGKLVREKDEDGREVERFQGDVLTYKLTPDWKQRAERFAVDPSWPWLTERPIPYIDQERWALDLASRDSLKPEHPDRKARCPDWRDVLQRLWKAGMLAKGKLTLTPKGRSHIGRERLLDPDGFEEAKPFALHVGPIGTGNKVVEDPTIWGRLSTSIRKVIGLEMEACAIGAIADAQVGRNVRAIVMKGVMDVANPDRDDRYKTFAARASAEVLLRFLREHLEPAKRELTPASEPPPQPSSAAASVIKGPVRLAVHRSEQELVGRDELLAEVRRALDDDTHRGVALHGMSGVGKTSIAETIGATDNERGVYPGGVFEVTGASEDLFLSGLAAIADTLGTPLGVTEEQKVGIARQRLLQATKRTLLVIDDLNPTAPWVERELRSLPGCVRVLATLTFWPIGFLNGPGRARWIEVPALAPEGAYALVKSIAPFLTEGEIGRLNAFLDGHTLGLEVAARTLASEPMLGVDGYLSSLKAGRERALDGASEVERSALSALGVLWERLPEAAQKAWRMCGAFDTAPVPDGWLRLALAETSMSEEDARRGIGELLKRHLATRVGEGAEVSLRFHSIVHTFSRGMAGAADRRAMAAGLTRWFEGTWDNEANLHLKSRMTLPHVETTSQNGGGDPEVARRLAVALRINGRQESLDRAVTILQSLLSQARDEQTEDADGLDWVRHELARVFSLPGTRDQLLEAERLLRKTLKLRDDGADPPSESLVVTLNDLGSVISDLGDRARIEEAEQLLRRALIAEETLSSGKGRGLAMIMGNLALVLGQLGDREHLEEAEQFARRALEIEESVLGPDAPIVALRLNTVASVLIDLGGRKHLEQAEQLARRALRIQEAALESDAPSTARTLNILAGVLHDLGGRERLEEAEQLGRRSVHIEEVALGKGAPPLASALRNLALVLLALGGPKQLEEAEQLGRRALQIRETALGGDAPDIAQVLTTLAAVLCRRGGDMRLSEAEQFLRRARAIDRQAFPDGSPNTAVIVANLASVLRQLGGQIRIREAQQLEGHGKRGRRTNATSKRKP
jgi:nucleoside phosphorylase